MLNDLWARAIAPWAVWDAGAHHRGRCRLDGAGHRRRAGSSAPGSARALLERGSEVVSLRPCPPRAAGPRRWRCWGSRPRSPTGRGRPPRRERLRRTLADHRSSAVFHLAAQTIVGDGGAPRRRRPSRPTSRHLDPARGLPRARGRAGRRRLLRQGLRRARRAALPRGLRAAADRAVRGLEGRGRPDRAQLLARLRAAGRRDPLRQHLRGRRPQLLAAGPRGRQRGARRPPRRCSAPTARPERDFLYVEDAARAYLAIADAARPRRRARRGLQRRRGRAALGGRGGRADRDAWPGTGVEPDIRGDG